ncbi:MAG: hypothetical protein J0H98_08165 [Solirubrobacterales bacterium]|nr:hypothetical protein [Solirubrobacterales bacterium]
MTQTSVTFVPAVEDLTGATCRVGEGETYDIVAALINGDGEIVLDLENPNEAEIANALRLHPAVIQDGTDPDGVPTEAPGAAVDNREWLMRHTRPELDQIAADRGLTGAENLKTKGDVVDLIETGGSPDQNPEG